MPENNQASQPKNTVVDAQFEETKSERPEAARPEPKEVIKLDSMGMFEPSNAEQVQRIAHSVIQSRALPAHISNTHVFCVAWNILSGMGLKPMAYMGKTYWNPKTQTMGIQTEVLLASVLKHPDYQGRREWLVDERYKELGADNWMDANPAGAVCVVRRRNGDGYTDTEARFSLKEASAMGLLGKQNWKSQPGNMLTIRARAKALKEAFADVIGGVAIQGYDDWDDEHSHPYDARQSTATVPAGASGGVARHNPAPVRGIQEVRNGN